MAAMPGNFEPRFWDALIFQLGHGDATVRAALGALSAVYEDREKEQQRRRRDAGQSEWIWDGAAAAAEPEPGRAPAVHQGRRAARGLHPPQADRHPGGPDGMPDLRLDRAAAG